MPCSNESAQRLGLDRPLDWASIEDDGLPSIDGLLPLVRSSLTTYLLFPNALISFVPGGAFMLSLWLQNEGTTQVDAAWYAPGWGEDHSPADAPGWLERLAWAERQLAELQAGSVPIQTELKELARTGSAVTSEARPVALWSEALDQRLGAAAPNAPLVGAGSRRPSSSSTL